MNIISNSGQSKTWKELKSYHKEYDAKLNLRLQLLAQGGYSIKKNAKMFLPQIGSIEKTEAYKDRLQCSAYIPMLSQFGTQITSSLFSEPLHIKIQADAKDQKTPGKPIDVNDDFYTSFINNVSGDNSPSLHSFMQNEVLKKSLYELCSYVCVDFPSGTDNIINRSQEEKVQSDYVYMYSIPYEQIIDYKLNADGSFSWLKWDKEIIFDDDPFTRNKHQYILTIPRMQNINEVGDNLENIQSVSSGVCIWEIWKSEILDLAESRSDSTKYTQVEVINTELPRVNIFKFEIEEDLHLGQNIGPISEEFYQRRSLLVSNSNKTCVSMMLARLRDRVGAEAGEAAMPAHVEQRANNAHDARAKLVNEGIMVGLSGEKEGDTFEIIEAKGTSHQFVSDDLTKLEERAAQVVHQMDTTAEANLKALGRSAASKSHDRFGQSMLLSFYEHCVKHFVKVIFTFISSVHGDEFKWEPEGLSTMQDTDDRKDVTDEIAKLGIPILNLPDAFKIQYLNRLMMALLDNDATNELKDIILNSLQTDVNAGKWDAQDVLLMQSAGSNMENAAPAPGSPPTGKPQPTNKPAAKPNKPVKN